MKRSLIFLTAVFGTVSCVPAADFHTGQAARLVIGQTTFSDGATGTSNTQLGSPSGVAYANNQLFIADANRLGGTPQNNRVLIYSNLSGQVPVPPDEMTSATGIAATCPACVGVANVVLGQPSFTTSDPGLSATGMRTPVAVASDGKVLAVADSDNNRVLIWNNIPANSTTPADVVIGQADFTHAKTASPPTAKSLRGPQGVWIQDGRLFVVDTQDNRVLIYNTIPTANNAAADVVLGQSSFTAYVSPDITKTNVDPTANNMSSPVAVSSDGRHLLVADLGHNRIMIWNSIPNQNNQAADLVVGQPDLVHQTPNYASTLCPSTGTDTAGKPIYPIRCGATLSFPRAAVSDGTRLFVADGGNDRVLVFSQFPTGNGASADAVLGQPTVNANFSSSNSDAFATPVSLAWDGSTNLYVGDTFNRRVVVYSPGEDEIAVTGVRNSASLEIYAIGRVVFGGTPAKDNVVTLTLGAKSYAYTVKDKDTIANIIAGLTALVNAGAGDPNVLAIPNTVANALVLTARKGGDAGVGTTYDATFSTGANLTRTTAGTALAINLASSTQIGPGSLITIEGANLSDQTAIADMSGSYLPTLLGGVEVYIDGIQAPLLYVSPTQINTQVPFEVQDRTSVSIFVRSVRNDSSVTASVPVGLQIVAANPGIFAFPGSDPRPGLVFHADGNATGLVSVDGVIKAGDVATVTISGTAYTYTVLATDTLQSVRDALVAKMANDPNVLATSANQFARILLEARVPGAAGNGVPYSVSVNSGATLVLTAFSSSLCCGGSNGGGTLVTADNPAHPGENVFVYATGLGITAPLVGNLTGSIFPTTTNPPATPVDSVLAGGTTANVISAALVPGLVGIWKVTFQLGAGLTTDPQTQLTIAQQLFVSNVVTFPVVAP